MFKPFLYYDAFPDAGWRSLSNSFSCCRDLSHRLALLEQCLLALLFYQMLTPTLTTPPLRVLDRRASYPSPVSGEYIISKWFCLHVCQGDNIFPSYSQHKTLWYYWLEHISARPWCYWFNDYLFFSLSSLFCSIVNSHFIWTAVCSELFIALVQTYSCELDTINYLLTIPHWMAR